MIIFSMHEYILPFSETKLLKKKTQKETWSKNERNQQVGKKAKYVQKTI